VSSSGLDVWMISGHDCPQIRRAILRCGHFVVHWWRRGWLHWVVSTSWFSTIRFRNF